MKHSTKPAELFGSFCLRNLVLKLPGIYIYISSGEFIHENTRKDTMHEAYATVTLVNYKFVFVYDFPGSYISSNKI